MSTKLCIILYDYINEHLNYTHTSKKNKKQRVSLRLWSALELGVQWNLDPMGDPKASPPA